MERLGSELQRFMASGATWILAAYDYGTGLAGWLGNPRWRSEFAKTLESSPSPFGCSELYVTTLFCSSWRVVDPSH